MRTRLTVALLAALLLAVIGGSVDGPVYAQKGKPKPDKGGGGDDQCFLDQVLQSPGGFSRPVLLPDPDGNERSYFGRQVDGRYVTSLSVVAFAVTESKADGHPEDAIHFYTVDPTTVASSPGMSGGVLEVMDRGSLPLGRQGQLKVADFNDDDLPDYISVTESQDRARAELFVSVAATPETPLHWRSAGQLFEPDGASRYGMSVAVGDIIRDIDGDGIDDGIDEFAVGAPGGRAKGGRNPGKVFVYAFNPDTEEISELLPTVVAGGTNDQFGWSVALGDVSDNSGPPYPELIVGAPATDKSKGAMFVFEWDDVLEQFDAGPASVALGTTQGDRVGVQVAAASVQGAAIGDAAIAATTWDTGNDRAEVFLHNPAATAMFDLALVATRPSKGWATQGVHMGDADEDGFTDVLVGAPNTSCGTRDSTGKLFFYAAQDECERNLVGN